MSWSAACANTGARAAITEREAINFFMGVLLEIGVSVWRKLCSYRPPGRAALHTVEDGWFPCPVSLEACPGQPSQRPWAFPSVGAERRPLEHAPRPSSHQPWL